MNTETFKKVIIRSAEDLPKEEGVYYWHFKGRDDSDLYPITFRGLQDWGDKYWLRYDWFLQPLPAEPKRMSDHIDLICKRCGSVQKTMRPPEATTKTHHLRCDWCFKCEKPGYDDFWEIFYCDKDGNEVTDFDVIKDDSSSLPGLKRMSDEYLEPIQNALYATNRFTTDECEQIAEGILNYINESPLPDVTDHVRDEIMSDTEALSILQKRYDDLVDIIAKQDELIKMLKEQSSYTGDSSMGELESELSALRTEGEKG
jgi:hypothetical protein